MAAAAAAARRIRTVLGTSTAAARRIETVLGASTAASRRIQTTILSSATASGPFSLISQDLLRRSPHTELRTAFGLAQPIYLRLQKRSLCSSSDKDVAIGKTSTTLEELKKVQQRSPTEDLDNSLSLQKLEYRISKLEAICDFYKKFQWMFLGPIVGLLVSIASIIYIFKGLSTMKERQKYATEDLSNLRKRIEYLQGRNN